jgi:hypothetical protein
VLRNCVWLQPWRVNTTLRWVNTPNTPVNSATNPLYPNCHDGGFGAGLFSGSALTLRLVLAREKQSGPIYSERHAYQSTACANDSQRSESAPQTIRYATALKGQWATRRLAEPYSPAQPAFYPKHTRGRSHQPVRRLKASLIA